MCHDPKESLRLKFTANCRLFGVMTVLTCTLYITGPQNPSFGRKSHGYSFWAADGDIDMVVIEPGITINWEHYAATLKTLKQLRRVWKHKNTLLQHDNARPHTLQTTMEAVEKLDLTIPWNLPYRPDLATFHFFSKTEGNTSWTRVCLKWRGRKVCHDLDEETNCGVLSWRLWETCPSLAKVCVESGGVYVEK
jgi:hypothetical protein